MKNLLSTHDILKTGTLAGTLLGHPPEREQGQEARRHQKAAPSDDVGEGRRRGEVPRKKSGYKSL